MSWSDAFTKIATTAALYLIVIGCQPVPQPFAHRESSINPMVVPSSDFAGITILPIAGLPDPTARTLSMAMAEALLSHEIIASLNRGNRRSRFLQGEVIRRAAGGALTEIAVRWDLLDSRGKMLGSKDTTLAFPRDDWEKSGQSVLRPLVKAAAAEIASLVNGGNDQSTNKFPIALHVWPLDGAPDRAVEPLRRAMESALKKRDFQIADGLEGAGLIIAGSIELGPESAEPRPIRITWSVMNTTGQELGKLTQQNALPGQAMETRWNTLAVLIADSAAGGVSDLVVQLPRKALRNDENPAK